MDIGVMGAGAVGCYYGAMLAQAGHKVTLIARPHHAAAIARNGLALERHGQTAYIPVQVSADAAALRGASLVLFCVKSNDTQTAGAAMSPYLAPETAILSLQNGVDNAENLAAISHRDVAPAVVYVATEMAGPGHVKHHGRGELVLGASAQNEILAQIFTAAGVPTSISENVMGALWDKMILNCAYNALSAISRLPYGLLVQRDGVTTVIRQVVEECLALTACLEITVLGDIWAAVRQIAETMPTQFSSTAQDIARGRPTEIDYLNGYVVRCGAAFGLSMPTNLVLHTLVKLLETSK